MIVSGLQKLTLLDYPGKVACTIFTPGCNFRCPFCHNAPLVVPDKIVHDTTEDEVLEFLKKRIGILDGVAITGGEPLIHNDIGEFLKKIKDMGYSVKLDHNGTRPDLLEKLVSEGLVDRVAMDIKNSPALYAKTAGLDNIDLKPIEQSKDYLLSGVIDYEFRTTVVKGLHTQQSLEEAAQWIYGAKEYYLQQFKDSGDVIAIDGLSAFDEKEMHELELILKKIIPTVAVRGV